MYASVSNERTFTRWGHAVARAVARKRPQQSAAAVARLHYDTEDGFPEVYVVLARYTDSHGPGVAEGSAADAAERSHRLGAARLPRRPA